MKETLRPLSRRLYLLEPGAFFVILQELGVNSINIIGEPSIGKGYFPPYGFHCIYQQLLDQTSHPHKFEAISQAYSNLFASQEPSPELHQQLETAQQGLRSYSDQRTFDLLSFICQQEACHRLIETGQISPDQVSSFTTHNLALISRPQSNFIQGHSNSTCPN